MLAHRAITQMEWQPWLAASGRELPISAVFQLGISGSHAGGNRRKLRHAHGCPQPQRRQRCLKLGEFRFMVKVENTPHLTPIDAEQLAYRLTVRQFLTNHAT